MKFLAITLQLILLSETSHERQHKKSENANRYLMDLIEGTMDASTDPCENFYQYACGNWDKMHTNVTKYHDYYRMIEYNTNMEMAKILAMNWNRRNLKKEPPFVTYLRRYYRSCVDTKTLQLMEYLKWLQDKESINVQSNGNSLESNNDWLQHLGVMKKYGLKGIFLEESYSPSTGTLKLHRPLKPNAFQQLTFKRFSTITYRTFTTKNGKQFAMDWTELSRFESGLMKILISEKGTIKAFTLHSLSQIPWLYRFVQQSLQNTQFRYNATQLKIVVQDLEYMSKLYNYLLQFNQKFLCEYLKIRFLWHLLQTSYIAKISPETCALKAREFMYLATDYLYEQQHPELVQSIPRIQKIFINIKTHYHQMLRTNPNGFTGSIMKFLLNKLKSTKLTVGLLPRENTVATLQNLYSPLNLHANASANVYSFQMQLLQFQANSSHFMKLQMVDDQSQYFEHTKRLSPYFLRKWSTVVLPMTTLQLPIYHAKLVDLFTYSSLGYILGHELTHCFDTNGTKRDPNGRYSELFHDVIHANPKFRQNLDCLRHLNTAAIDEKISDVTGFRVAYQTYFELNPKDRTKRVLVNGRNFTLDKMFFLNYAQFRCTTSQETLFRDNDHGTHEDRTVDAVSHFPEFAKSFNCHRNSNRFAAKTCQLWRK